MNTGKLPNTPQCPGCGQILDGWTDPNGADRGPGDGDCTVCFYCEAVLTFRTGTSDGELRIEKIDVEMVPPELRSEMQNAIRTIREVKLLEKALGGISTHIGEA